MIGYNCSIFNERFLTCYIKDKDVHSLIVQFDVLQQSEKTTTIVIPIPGAVNTCEKLMISSMLLDSCIERYGENDKTAVIDIKSLFHKRDEDFYLTIVQEFDQPDDLFIVDVENIEARRIADFFKFYYPKWSVVVVTIPPLEKGTIVRPVSFEIIYDALQYVYHNGVRLVYNKRMHYIPTISNKRGDSSEYSDIPSFVGNSHIACDILVQSESGFAINDILEIHPEDIKFNKYIGIQVSKTVKNSDVFIPVDKNPIEALHCVSHLSTNGKKVKGTENNIYIEAIASTI